MERPNWCGPLRDYKYAEILIPSAFWVFGQKMGQLEPMSHKLQTQAASFTSALQYAKQIISYDMERLRNTDIAQEQEKSSHVPCFNNGHDIKTE